MLKKLIGVVSLLTTSSLSIASGISTMTGNASLSDTATNWDPAFVDGNTIVVGVDNISLNANASKTIGAIRLDHDLTINYQTGTAYTFTIGSIAGSGKMTFNLQNDTLNLSGTAGTNNSPLANDYSGFFSIIISNQPTINVNAPVTIGSTFSKTNDTTIKFNFNENTTITDSSFTQISNGEYNISANKLLTLSGSDMTLTSAFNFSDSGQLILSGDNTIFNPSSVSNASSAVLNVDNNVTTSMPSVLTINTINISDGKSFTIDAVNSDIDLLDDNASINFSGSNATLVLTNSGTSDRTFTAYNTVTGNVLFSSDGTLVASKGITGNIDFAGNNGVLQLADNQSITGNVDSTGSSAGTLEFLGKGTVTGSIGATNALTALKFSGAGATNIPAASTETIEIANAGAVVTTTDLLTGNVLFSGDGSLIADKGITGNIDFDSKAASLTFNGDAGDNWYTLDGTISNAGSALLEVDTKLKVIDKGIGGVKTINIGEGGILSIESNEANLALISAAEGKINFTDDDAQLLLSAPQNQTINFAASIAGSDNGGGTILLDGNGYNLTVTLSDDAFLGTNDKKIGAINVSGNVIFDASVDANAASLNINNGAYLTDYSAAAESIDSINIGNEQGAGEYILDARDDDFSINTDNITFKNEDSVLALGSSSVDAERTITLETSIVPSQDKYGVLTLYSTRDKKLTIDNNDDETITIGTAENRLKQLTLSSDGDAEFDIKPTINVESLGLDLSKIDLGEVDANIIFHNNTQYNANGDINGSVDFAGQDGVINVADNANISGSISSTDSASGTLNFLGSSTIGGIVSNISTIQAGAGDVTFSASGDYSIGELQGNGSGTITFPSDMNFTGDVNTSGGEPLNLSFADNTGVAGNIGSSSSLVGNVSSGNNTQFNGDINSSADVITSGTTVFAGGVTSNNIIANKTSSNMLSLSLTTLTSAFSVSSSNRINFDEANAITQFQGIVNTTGNIEVNGSTYFADTVNSGGNVVINGNTKFNKTLSSNNGISISGGSNVIFNGDVSSSSINIDNANIGVTDNIEVQGDVSASNSSILLDGNTLTLSGTHTFSDQITISSTYDASGLSGGNIILQSGSTLDLSNVSELTIKLAFINSDISNITDDTKYNIILAEDGSNIVLLSDPENQVILDSSGEQNRFVKWTLDTRSLTLYASDDSDNDYVFDSIQNNTFMQELKNASSDSLAQEFKNNIRLLSKEQVEDMFSRILDHPKERSSDIVRVVLHQALTDTNRTAINIIRNRLLSTGPSNAIASAGDEDVSQYGVWARSSINQSKDKVSGKDSEYFSSYKTRGNSNTIGVDGLLRDNLLIGAAYTNAYTSIRPKDQNIGNVDKVRTNMFSLYSAYNIPNYNWYLDNTVSYAESSVQGQKIRYLAVARDVLGSEVASSKYKSRLYSGSVSLGYNYNLNNNIYVTPSLGAIGSLIRDKGYAESGASFQNLTVRKKSYNKLTGVAGLRTYQDIYVDNNESGVIVTPEAYGFVNYNIKNKVPAIDARLLGIDQPLPTINHRGNRVDYNLGLGITIKQNMMEYGINYDANLAKKYQGHSGSLKVRVNL